MNKFKRLCLSYIFASFASIAVGGVVAFLYAHFTKTDVVDWVFVAIIWLVVVGIPSLFAAADDLTGQLGRKPAPVLRELTSRTIPINYDKGISTFAYVMGRSPTTPNGKKALRKTSLDLPELEIQYGEYVISERELNNFLRSAWRRQRGGHPALSRNYWITEQRFDWGEYQALVGILEQANLINGRTQGRSGKLRYPPSKAIALLAERL